jgi:hypothetical protein
LKNSIAGLISLAKNNGIAVEGMLCSCVNQSIINNKNKFNEKFNT